MSRGRNSVYGSWCLGDIGLSLPIHIANKDWNPDSATRSFSFQKEFFHCLARIRSVAFRKSSQTGNVEECRPVDARLRAAAATRSSKSSCPRLPDRDSSQRGSSLSDSDFYSVSIFLRTTTPLFDRQCGKTLCIRATILEIARCWRQHAFRMYISNQTHSSR